MQSLDFRHRPPLASIIITPQFTPPRILYRTLATYDCYDIELFEAAYIFTIMAPWILLFEVCPLRQANLAEYQTDLRPL
jgi:hypothetical protein